VSTAPKHPAPPDALTRAIEKWFGKARRSLPWRPDELGASRDPYACLVSELMLQQTQVSRVIERFETFMDRFPSATALAEADEEEVLALWSGLGYYRRARNLHAAARAIVDEHHNRFPSEASDIQSLPGVGRYTAGAIASMAFGERTPVVDGNVARVLLRISGDDAPPDSASTQKRLWSQAADLANAADHPGVLNEALMELGALICTPRAPSCERCPARSQCKARELGRQNELPTPKRAARQKELYCDTVRVRDARGRLLVERRGTDGLWGGLYQAPTVERSDRHARPSELLAWIGADALARAERFTHRTTHRVVRIRVWDADPVRGMGSGGRAWRSRRQIGSLALSSPQRRILLPA